MIPISKPSLGEAEVRAVSAVLTSGQIAQGRRVAEFEEAFAACCGVKHAIATTSGTTALWAALLAHQIGPGDEVITSPFTFIASANAIRYAGATPVFVDIEPQTFNIDPGQIEAKITPRTRAILPVHLYGHPANMAAIMALAHKYNLAVIEDACQAHGAAASGRKVGSFGTGCFSFYATKNITTGEGGMITTNDDEVAGRARLLRAHGMRRRYYHEMLGYNFRMTDIQAAIGLAQLAELENFTRQRQANAQYLLAKLSKLDGLCLPVVRPGYVHVFHQFTVRVLGDREAFCQKLAQRGVATAVYYPVPVHKQQTFLEAGGGQHLPLVEEACRQVVSLPVHPALSRSDLDCIIDAVKSAL